MKAHDFVLPTFSNLALLLVTNVDIVLLVDPGARIVEIEHGYLRVVRAPSRGVIVGVIDAGLGPVIVRERALVAHPPVVVIHVNFGQAITDLKV